MMKRILSGVVLFWALYFSAVTASNAADLLQHLGALGPGWSWVSGNFGLLQILFESFKLPFAAEVAMFLIIIAVEAAAAALFWRAWRHSMGAGSFPVQEAQAAFATAMGLFAAFTVGMEAIATEAAYSHEPLYFTELIALMLGLLLLRVPDRQG